MKFLPRVTSDVYAIECPLCQGLIVNVEANPFAMGALVMDHDFTQHAIDGKLPPNGVSVAWSVALLKRPTQ